MTKVKSPGSVYDHLMKKEHKDFLFDQGRMEMWQVGMGKPMPNVAQLAALHAEYHRFNAAPSESYQSGFLCGYIKGSTD